MISALYDATYFGHAGDGYGVVYIGNGRILGVDPTNARFTGIYMECGGRINGTVTITAVGMTVVLVTGTVLPSGWSLPVTFDVPADLNDGELRSLTVGGQKLGLRLDKIGDIP